ncbi:MAG: hypothetical protein NTV31_03275 [Bacteroidia bacterium]|nr:hypothetical protein [Bacteroidia bacterium]
MKRKPLKLIASLILMMVVSCDEPKTVVTNSVHPDGSVTRKILMSNTKNKFDLSALQVPFDKTWDVKDIIKISEKGDTTWIKKAEKLFKNVDEINLTYKQDSGANKEISRQAGFKKRFKWFNTEFRFSETIDKKMSFGYPVGDFLNDEELSYFYSPDSIIIDKLVGPDSLKFKAFGDTLSLKTDRWMSKSIVSEWIGEFTRLTEGKAGIDMTRELLKAREDEFVKLVELNKEKFDSLWSNGILLKEFIGEANALRYKTEADSAFSLVTENFWVDFKEYTVKIVMPGKLIGTNGFIDSSKVLLWPVKSDYFLTEPYVMWAESKIPNRWAWIVSGLFLLFVLTGVIIRVIKKG